MKIVTGFDLKPGVEYVLRDGSTCVLFKLPDFKRSFEDRRTGWWYSGLHEMGNLVLGPDVLHDCDIMGEVETAKGISIATQPPTRAQARAVSEWLNANRACWDGVAESDVLEVWEKLQEQIAAAQTQQGGA